MPIQNSVDKKERVVYSTCVGTMHVDDFIEYIQKVWSHNKYFGFNELFDTTQADWGTFMYADLFDVARRASQLPTLSPKSKLAWVVLEGKQRELTDFYKSAKSAAPMPSRSLEAFNSKHEAMQWLNSKS